MMAVASFSAVLLALQALLLASAIPTPEPATTSSGAATSYWLASIARQGTVAYGSSSFQIYRNVKDFGAKGQFE